MRVKPVGASTSGNGSGTPEEGGRRVGRAHAPEDARVEADAAERGRVLGHGVLVLGAAVDVVEHATGQTPAGHDPQIVHVGGPRQAAFDGVELEAAEPHAPSAVFRSSDEC